LKHQLKITFNIHLNSFEIKIAFLYFVSSGSILLRKRFASARQYSDFVYKNKVILYIPFMFFVILFLRTTQMASIDQLVVNATRHFMS